MCEILVNDIQKVRAGSSSLRIMFKLNIGQRTDPHSQLIFYDLLLCHGCRRPEFFRSHKRWQPLLPLLMDHVLVEIDPSVEDTYFGMAGGSNATSTSVPVPIEAKLRSLGVRLLYEVCRVQKLSIQDLSAPFYSLTSGATIILRSQEYLMTLSLITYSTLWNRRDTCKMKLSITVSSS